MPNKSLDPKIYPLNIVGFVIMVADLIALGYWMFLDVCDLEAPGDGFDRGREVDVVG
jgi:hypothetical protein